MPETLFVLWVDHEGGRRVLPRGCEPGEGWRKKSGVLAGDQAEAERHFASWDAWERECQTHWQQKQERQ